MVSTALIIILVIAVIGLIVSFRVMSKQQNKELDKTMGPTMTKHPIAANPALLAYVLFPVVVIIGALIFMYFYS